MQSTVFGRMEMAVVWASCLGFRLYRLSRASLLLYPGGKIVFGGREGCKLFDPISHRKTSGAREGVEISEDRNVRRVT